MLSRRPNDAANLQQRTSSLVQRFLSECAGTATVFFALIIPLFFGTAALMLDFGYATTVKVRQQKALDAAALAASDQLGTTDGEATGRSIAEAFYKANTARNPDGVLMDLQMNTASGTVSSKARTGVDTWLMRALGVKSVGVRGTNQVARGSGTVEVTLVLDNSGSMSPELDNLKSAAKEMAGILYVGADGTEKVRVGLVPFAASVNVGAQNSGESWIDSSSQSPVHSENFSAPSNRFDLFRDMGLSWRGCVEVRPSPYDVSDAVPSSGNPSTLFVPMFAPDEPDSINSAGNSYPNNYLDDDGGDCAPQSQTCKRYSRRGNCKKWVTDPISPEIAQSRVCKYKTPYTGGAGPNYNCTTAQILPLTSTKAEVEAAIDGMVASGWTNILQGTTWGWRVLSPDLPFTEGRGATEENRQYLVIMTDGENTYQKRSNHNQSMYGAFGYTSQGRLPTGSPAGEMDDKTIAACANAKAAGITIFTVAFREAATNAAARRVLSSCASTEGHALTATDGVGLRHAFEDIGRQITKLRIAG